MHLVCLLLTFFTTVHLNDKNELNKLSQIGANFPSPFSNQTPANLVYLPDTTAIKLKYLFISK